MGSGPFYFRRCCRVWPLVYAEGVGRCGLCNQHPEELATREEYDAQEPLIPPVDNFSPLDIPMLEWLDAQNEEARRGGYTVEDLH